MADKGLAYSVEARGRRMSMLFPSAPGIFEFPFMARARLDLPYERLARPWQEYYQDGWAQEMTSDNTHLGRVVPVQQAVNPGLQVLPRDLVARYIQNAKNVALTDCACRVAYHRCDAPRDVCLGLNHGARFLSERCLARPVSVDEALDALHRAEKAGLVHCVSNTRDAIEFICNLCPCCCGLLGTVTRMGTPAARMASAFYPAVDAEACTAYGICEGRCPTRAMSVDDVATIELGRCLGCGLCVSSCPSDAVRLQRKAEASEPPKDHAEWLARVAAEKGRTERFERHLNI